MKKKDKDLVPIKPSNIMAREVIMLDPSDLDNATEWEDFIGLWMRTKELEMMNQWYKGDIASRVTVVFGEGSVREFAKEVQEKESTIESYRRVSRAFSDDKRNLNVSWTHYYLASLTDSYNKGEKKFDGEDRFDWVEKANDNAWTTVRMAEEIKKNNALKSGDESIYSYYDDYLNKVNNVLNHIEKDKLSALEAKMLLDKLRTIHRNLVEYFSDIS